MGKAAALENGIEDFKAVLNSSLPGGLKGRSEGKSVFFFPSILPLFFFSWAIMLDTDPCMFGLGKRGN